MVGPRKEASEKFHLIVTWRCNGNCPGCIFAEYVRKGKIKDMSATTQKRVVGKIGRFHDVSVLGGEPALHPRFWQLLEEIVAKKPQSVRVISNGINFSENFEAARKWLSRFNRISKKASIARTNIFLVVSVGDMHANGLKGGQKEMKERIQTILRALPKDSAFSFNFLAELAKKQRPREIIRKYCLPKNTPTAPWHFGAVGGTVPKTIIAPNGRVFGTEADLVAGRKPIGHINKPIASLFAKRKLR